MYVTQHAQDRFYDRLGMLPKGTVPPGQNYLAALERVKGPRGTVAYLLAQLPAGATLSRDGSNGDLVYAVAVDGSVETIYFRRSKQDNSPAFFGARMVVDLRHGDHPRDRYTYAGCPGCHPEEVQL